MTTLNEASQDQKVNLTYTVQKNTNNPLKDSSICTESDLSLKLIEIDLEPIELIQDNEPFIEVSSTGTITNKASIYSKLVLNKNITCLDVKLSWTHATNKLSLTVYYKTNTYGPYYPDLNSGNSITIRIKPRGGAYFRAGESFTFKVYGESVVGTENYELKPVAWLS